MATPTATKAKVATPKKKKDIKLDS